MSGNDRSRIYEQVSALVLDYAKILIDVSYGHAARRAPPLVPREELPHGAHWHLHGPYPLAQTLESRHGTGGRVVHLHLDDATAGKFRLGRGDDAPAEGREEFEPTQNWNHRQREYARVELAEQVALYRVNPLRDPADFANAPRARLEFVKLEEKGGLVLAERLLLLGVLERLLDSKEEGRRTEYAMLNSCEHELPFAGDVVEGFGDVGVGVGHGDEGQDLGTSDVHGGGVIQTGCRVVGLATIEGGAELEDLCLQLVLGRRNFAAATVAVGEPGRGGYRRVGSYGGGKRPLVGGRYASVPRGGSIIFRGCETMGAGERER